MSESMILGLTGGIGSGKSTAADMLRRLGATVLDADEISRHALDPGTECYRATVSAFGDAIVREDGSIDRKALAGIVFSDDHARKTLNGIIHPYVHRTIHSETERARAAHARLIVWDIPLLFETGYDKETDAVLVICCSIPVRLERLKKRSGYSEEEALSRIRAQMTDEERCERATFTVHNEGTLESLQEQVSKIYEQLLCGNKTE